MPRIANFRWGLSGEPQAMEIDALGRVAWRGPAAEFTGEPEIDLDGAYVLPSFVDAHCHILPTGLDLLKLSLGGATSREEVLDRVRERHQEQPDGWLHAVHYDQNRYGGHVTRADLDAISDARPILLRHQNGHASVANSAALLAAGVDESTPDPDGGTYNRDADGRMNGVLLELAHERVTSSAPRPTQEEMVEAILRAGESMRAYGIGCATDMMTGVFDLEDELEAYRIASERGCAIAMRLFVQWKTVFGPRGIGAERLRNWPLGDPARLRVAGIKLFADGAISSATAAIYGRYTGETPSGPIFTRQGTKPAVEGREVSGQLIYTPERLTDLVRTAHEAGFPVSIHAIGDYAIDLSLDAYLTTDEPSRHRIEHATLLRPEQIERIAMAGCHVTFQPEFLMRLGHAYARQLGPERSFGMKPVSSTLRAGISVSFNSDRPIVGGNPWDGIRTAVRRPDGFDPAENVPWDVAIRLYAEGGSAANRDGRTFGTLEPGAIGDYQVLNESPEKLATGEPGA